MTHLGIAHNAYGGESFFLERTRLINSFLDLGRTFSRLVAGYLLIARSWDVNMDVYPV